MYSGCTQGVLGVYSGCARGLLGMSSGCTWGVFGVYSGSYLGCTWGVEEGDSNQDWRLSLAEFTHLVDRDYQPSYKCKLWQCGLWSFQAGLIELERLLPKN